MSGMPKRRARREAAARQALANRAAQLEAQNIPERTEYSPQLTTEICELIAAGVPFDDTTVGEDVAVRGICSLVRVSARTLYRWQEKYPEFAEQVARARIESSHRLADKMNSLAQLALDQPALANAVRIAGDILKWSAAVRNPETYSERKNIHMHANIGDLGEALRRSKMKTIEGEVVPCPNPVSLPAQVTDSSGAEEQ